MKEPPVRAVHASRQRARRRKPAREYVGSVSMLQVATLCRSGDNQLGHSDRSGGAWDRPMRQPAVRASGGAVFSAFRAGERGNSRGMAHELAAVEGLDAAMARASYGSQP
jgi:hypothetical protein